MGPGGFSQSGPGYQQSFGPGGASQSGPGYQQSAGPRGASQSGPGYQQSAGPGRASQSGPGYSQEAGPGHACQSGPGYSQCADARPPMPSREAKAAGAAAVLVGAAARESAREKPAASCSAQCDDGSVSIGCPAGQTPVCQCVTKPRARCDGSKQATRQRPR
jgi:hypothetical protein